MRLLSTLALIIVNLTASLAQAETQRIVNINLVVVESRLSPSAESQIAMFVRGIERLRELKLKPRIIKIDIVPDLYNVNQYEQIYSRLYTWSKYGKKQRFKGIVFYLLPPLEYKGVGLAAGQAGAICVFTRNKHKKFAEGVMREVNSSGYSRVLESEVIAGHEGAHLAGANHIDRKGFEEFPNMMNSNAQAYATSHYPLPFADLTKRHVRWCRQGKNVLGKPL
jgi:hypothetical protein